MTDPSKVDFRKLQQDAGSEAGGRDRFERFLHALVGVEHPTASVIRADPGDWGIDVIVGDMTDVVAIWQAKYFLDGLGNSQQKQVRESFDSVTKYAAQEGHRIESWTLCVACDLSASERQWWDGKVKAWKKAHPDMHIELWEAGKLRVRLASPEAKDVWSEYFGPSKDLLEAASLPGAAPDPLPLAPRDQTPAYDEALFVRQMQVAGISELDAQRYAYFNAEMLVRDVNDRAVPAELAAVAEVDATLHGSWEIAMANPATAPNASDYEESARRLFVAVMEKADATSPPAKLPLRTPHTRGMVHRIVEDSRAGWVHDWRDVARQHSEDREQQKLSPADGPSEVAP